MYNPHHTPAQLRKGKVFFFCTKMMVTRNKTTTKHGTVPGRQCAMLLGEIENAKI